MGDICYMFERLNELQLLEDYGPPIDISQLTIGTKSNKIIKKNPIVRQLISKTETFKAQLLLHNTMHGRWSFAIGNLRGLGTKDDSKFILNWIGSHEDYNNETRKR
jgi:hypothetical protein